MMFKEFFFQQLHKCSDLQSKFIFQLPPQGVGWECGVKVKMNKSFVLGIAPLLKGLCITPKGLDATLWKGSCMGLCTTAKVSLQTTLKRGLYGGCVQTPLKRGLCVRFFWFPWYYVFVVIVSEYVLREMGLSKGGRLKFKYTEWNGKYVQS